MKNTLSHAIGKLLSRKFLTAAAGIIMGVVMIVGGDAEAVNTLAGAVVSLVSTVSYIVIEGRVDISRAADAALRLQQAADILDEE